MMFPEQWMSSELGKILGFDPTEIVNYIKTIDDYEDQLSYLSEMLDQSDPNHINFIHEFSNKVKSSAKIDALAPPGMVAYKKKEEFEHGGARPKSSKASTPKPESKKEEFSSHNKNDRKDPKKSGKFVPLFSNDGKIADSAVMLPGRNRCDCQAQKHDLINNCTKCGRIVCQQEGSGPCLFCNHLVCTREEQEVLNRGSKKSETLMKKLMASNGNWNLNENGIFVQSANTSKSKAENLKNKLLEYDRTSEKRTKVIDDESDYFAVDSDKWLTKEQRKKLKEKEKAIHDQRHGSRLNKKYTFDFAGRQVVEDTFDITKYDPSNDEELQRIMKDVSANSANSYILKMQLKDLSKKTEELALVANPGVPRPMFIEEEATQKHMKSSPAWSSNTSSNNRNHMRIQDSNLQVMRDDGWCLSMHQPWASYLVTGIKLHEGRTWYSPHRGRLWIHAASKVPSDDEIAAVQQMYLIRDPETEIEFPKDLPVSCLLGCVDVDDVLAQEEYREKYPKGESSSPFVFICSNPQEMMLKYPMNGQHKIYKLDSNIHKAALKMAKKQH